MSAVLARAIAAARANLRAPHISRTLRPATRAYSSTTDAAKSIGLSPTAAIYAGCIASTALGYYLGVHKAVPAKPDADTREQPVQVQKEGSKPSYGGPEDFARAIAELREAFHDTPDVVSTDADDVDGHGNSVSIPQDGASPSYRPPLRFTDRRNVLRTRTRSCGIPIKHGRRRENRQDRNAAQDADHSVLWWYQS